ncbi:MAG TPA: hypothetical protein VJ276_26460 [Thermoanaerobaculia bacterium]|nr:hypothetical protein [Thermoanaerobaculia bacterium]
MVNKVDATVSFVDAATLKVLGSVSVGEGPHEVAASTDGRTALVSIRHGPQALQFTPDGKRAFISCTGAGKVEVLDLQTLKITGSVATGNQPDGLAYAVGP